MDEPAAVNPLPVKAGAERMPSSQRIILIIWCKGRQVENAAIRPMLAKQAARCITGRRPLSPRVLNGIFWILLTNPSLWARSAHDPAPISCDMPQGEPQEFFFCCA